MLTWSICLVLKSNVTFEFKTLMLIPELSSVVNIDCPFVKMCLFFFNSHYCISILKWMVEKQCDIAFT